MGDTLEIVKAFTSPTEKLIGAVQNAIGKAYEPRHIRKMADAKAYEIEKVGKTMREFGDIAITYDKGSLKLDTADMEMFIKRTQNRLAYQELMKQRNIEAVIDSAYEYLENEVSVDNEPIDHDWMLRFFNNVEDISNEEMQKIWAMVLAGEIKHPKNVSMRTLNVLKNLGQNEAVEFKRLAPFVLRAPGNKSKDVEDYFILPEIIYKYDFEYPTLEQLTDAGLLSIKSNVTTYISIEPYDEEWVIGTGSKIRFYNKTGCSIIIKSHAFMLTLAGKELLKVAFANNTDNPPACYIEDCLDVFLYLINKENVETDILST